MTFIYRGNMAEVSSYSRDMAILQKIQGNRQQGNRQQGNRQQGNKEVTQKRACVHQSCDYIQIYYLVNLVILCSIQRLHSLGLLTTHLNNIIKTNMGEGNCNQRIP